MKVPATGFDCFRTSMERETFMRLVLQASTLSISIEDFISQRVDLKTNILATILIEIRTEKY